MDFDKPLALPPPIPGKVATGKIKYLPFRHYMKQPLTPHYFQTLAKYFLLLNTKIF